MRMREKTSMMTNRGCLISVYFLLQMVGHCVGGLTNVCTTNVSVTAGGPSISAGDVTGYARIDDVTFPPLDNHLSLEMGHLITTPAGGSLPFNFTLDFNVAMYDSTLSPDRVTVTMTIELISGSLTQTNIHINIGNTLEAFWGAGIPSGANLIDRNEIIYNSTSLTSPGNSETITFTMQPTGDGGVDLLDQTDIIGQVTFESGGATYEYLLPEICLEKDLNEVESIIYQQGFTALTFFVFFVVGIVLAIVAIYLYLYICRRRRDSSVSPAEDRRMRQKGKKIVMDAKAAMKKGNNAIKDFSLIDWNDSIVFILSMKDKLHMFREIDNLDILSTIYIDTDLEIEQVETAMEASRLLVQGLRHNGDISREAEERSNGKFQNNLKDLNKKLDEDYKKELETVYLYAEAKNKGKMGEMLRIHKEQRHEAVMVVKDLSDAERKQMMELLDKQQNTEENELTYKLALQQNEEAEKLRKEYAIRKRMGVKELQSRYMDDVVKEGELTAQKAEWLIKQHKEQQDAIHAMYDDEISRQRMNLEEKLARRKALAQASETQEDDQKELLNALANIHFTFIAKLKKSDLVTTEQIEDYTNKAKNELVAMKGKLDADKEARQEQMFKRLSQSKRKSLTELIAKHKSELQDYIVKNKNQSSTGPVDPVSYTKGLISLKSKQRKELTSMENQIDETHAKELESMRDQMMEGSRRELKELEAGLVVRVRDDGLKDEAISKILRVHEKNVNDLTTKQLESRDRQELKLKDELARRKREWDDKRAQEKKEQEDLREHESIVVEKLIGSQLSISDLERDRIMKEHEKQMVKLENSLTLNKLRQMRMLEEKIAQRKAQQMEELNRKQDAEMTKHRQIAEHNGEEDDEATRRKQLSLMKKHAEQRIALVQGQDLNLDDQMEDIKSEMTKERALALKGQSERLGALITSLQMEKAREMSKIEEQQKAINNLKANVMDDLNARGILSTPEMERILDIHKSEQDKLNDKLDNQRSKQEKMLRAKLAERLQQREHSILEKQDGEMNDMIQRAANKSSAKIRRMLLMHKHMVEMEKFKNKLDREISQSLENTRRDFEVQKQKIIQDQELDFVAGLVRIGNFSQHELVDVLHMLFPGKTEEAIKDILDKIYEEDKENKNRPEPSQSTLADRIYTAQYSNPAPLHKRGSVMTLTQSVTSKKLTKKGSKSSLLGSGSRDEYAMAYARSSQPADEYERRRSQVDGYDDQRRISQAYNQRRLDDDDDKRNRYDDDRRNRYDDDRRNRYDDDGRTRYDDDGRNRYDDGGRTRYDDDRRNRYDDDRRNRYDDDGRNRYDDDRRNRYDDETDYIGHNVDQEPKRLSGRLSPLKQKEMTSGKKKKKGLLKKLAKNQEDDYDDDLL